MTDNEKIQRAEQLISEANALLNEVNATHDNEKDIIAKYKEDYCKKDKYFLNGNSQIKSLSKFGCYDFEEVKGLIEAPYQYYLTKELAEQAKEMKDFNDKLLAFKYCYDLDYKPEWGTSWDVCYYYVYYDIEDEEYRYEYTRCVKIPTVYFSSEEIAQKCADWLNSLSE